MPLHKRVKAQPELAAGARRPEDAAIAH